MRGCVEFCPSALGTHEAADLPRSTAGLAECSEGQSSNRNVTAVLKANHRHLSASVSGAPPRRLVWVTRTFVTLEPT